MSSLESPVRFSCPVADEAVFDDARVWLRVLTLELKRYRGHTSADMGSYTDVDGCRVSPRYIQE